MHNTPLFDTLQRLLQALAPRERRTVERRLAGKSQRLWQLLQQPSDQLRQALHDEGYSSDYLAADLHKLYAQALDAAAQQAVEQHASDEIGVYSLLQRALMLLQLRLPQQALQWAKKAQEYAQVHELYGAAIEAAKLQQRCLKGLSRTQEAIDLSPAIQHFSQLQSQQQRLYALYLQSENLRRQQAKARTAQASAQLQQLAQQALTLAEESDQSQFYAQFYLLEIQCNAAFVDDAVQAELQANQGLLHLYEQHPAQRLSQPLNYVVIATRILILQRRLQPDGFFQALQDYRALPKRFDKQRQQIESMVFIFSYNYELETYLNQYRWSDALELVPTVLAGLQRYRHQVGDEFRLTSYFRFAVAYLFYGQCDMALDYLQKVLEEFAADTRADVQRVARLVQLLAHYELGNLQLLAHLVQTSRYALKKQKAVYAAEKLILSYFQRLSRLRRQDATRRLLQRLREALAAIFASSDYEKRLQDVFDFSHWLGLKCAENA